MLTRRSMIKAVAGLGLTAMIIPGYPYLKRHKVTVFRAGVGRSDVQLDNLYPISEFTGQHDPLSIRVLLTETDGIRQAIAVVDLTSLTQEAVSDLKSVLTDVTGVSAEQAIINAGHSFSTPHILTDGNSDKAGVSAEFASAMRLAALQAMDTLQPALMGAGCGLSRIGVNRNIATPSGWWLGADDAGFTDPHVGVLSIQTLNGHTLALLINCAVQPAIMDASALAAGGRLVSADLAGAVSDYVENHYGVGTVAFYLVGCAGDQVPYFQASRHIVRADGSASRVDMHEAGFALLSVFGQRLGDEVIRAAGRIVHRVPASPRIKRVTIPLPALEGEHHTPPTGPVRSFDYHVRGKSFLPVILVLWGDVAVVGLQPELSARLGVQIRAGSPFAHTFVITMADGAAKYLPDKESYDRFTYEARSSAFAPGAGEAAARAIVEQLKEIHRAGA